MPADLNPVVHLELLTGDLPRACAFYARLCGWRTEWVGQAWGSYLALQLGAELGGGMVECSSERGLWLPYVEVDEIHRATECARRLGADVLLDAREGPAGWRSVIAVPAGGQIALWQQKH